MTAENKKHSLYHIENLQSLLKTTFSHYLSLGIVF